jgi:aminoglycoside phosphotransferase (APT) family kinase protein
MEQGSAGLDELQGQLERWAAAVYDSSASIAGLRTMPGHAGLSFGFDVVHHGEVLDPLVLRMPPKGVRRSGNTDVLRQIPLLQALWSCGVPVPETRWWDEDEQWFGVPFTMVTRLPGDTLNVRAVAESRPPSAARAEVAGAFEQAVDALAKIHLVPWRKVLVGWEDAKRLVDEVRFWDRLLDKSAESEWVPMGRAVRDRLLATIPERATIGVFHGDYQTSNLLYDGGVLVAVLDWEISGIGAQLLDLGWLLMMNDPASWFDGEGLAIVPPFEELVARYADATGRDVGLAEVAWYRALSGYRFGVISCFNVMLHRSGKRPDPEWDRIAPSVPFLFGRARHLLGG